MDTVLLECILELVGVASCSRDVAECVRRRASPSNLFECPGFDLAYIACDSMHCRDLGLFPDALAGLMFAEIDNKDYHASRAVGIAWLNLELANFYKANPGLSQLHLTLSMIKSKGGWPTLKCKAAECRHLSGFGLVLAQRHARGVVGSPPFCFRGRLAPYSAEYRTLILGMAQNLHRYDESCVVEPFSMAECRDAMHGFCTALLGLRLLWRRNLAPELHAMQPFGWRPKGHMLEHLVDDKIQLWGSPRNFWCYADEDIVGLIKRIAVQNQHPVSLETVLLAKFRLFAALHALPLAAAQP